MIKDIGEFKFEVRDFPASDHQVIREVIEQNNYQFDSNKVKHGLCIDLGANMGCFSVLAGKYSHVIAYEPETNNYNLLLKNIVLNQSDVMAVKIAVGKEGITTINDLQACSAVGMPGETVEVVNINTILDPLDMIDYLKIDVEGSEYDIIEDITIDNLKKCENIVLEFHPPFNERFDNCIEKLKSTHDGEVCLWTLK